MSHQEDPSSTPSSSSSSSSNDKTNNRANDDAHDETATTTTAAATTNSSSTSTAMMTPDERLQWLRDRGVQIIESCSEERRQRETKTTTTRTITANDTKKGSSYSFAYVRIPADTSQPLVQCTATLPAADDSNSHQTTTTATIGSHSDYLLEHLKPQFQTQDASTVDLSLLKEQQQQSKNAPTLLASSSSSNNNTNDKDNGKDKDHHNPLLSVSDDTLRHVAEREGHVEVFPLVRATASNRYTAINLYVDEIGLLKRLPLNHRASQLAERAGYNPPPTFYGTLYIGRTQYGPNQNQNNNRPCCNQSFVLGHDTQWDTIPLSPWLQAALTQNLEYQQEQEKLQGRQQPPSLRAEQPAVDGTEGQAKEETNFTWTQTEEELELTIPLPISRILLPNNKSNDNNHPTSTPLLKQVQKCLTVKFLPRSVTVITKQQQQQQQPSEQQNTVLLSLPLFQPVDVDGGGCTWTLERRKENENHKDHQEEGVVLVVTLEKQDAALWPRIRD